MAWRLAASKVGFPLLSNVISVTVIPMDKSNATISAKAILYPFRFSNLNKSGAVTTRVMFVLLTVVVWEK
jgi:hypothetical protein